MAERTKTQNGERQKAFREIRRAFEQNLPGMFGSSRTIREDLDSMEGKVPSGVTNKHFKVYETTHGEAAFRALAHAASEVTKADRFKPQYIVDAIEDWLMDKQFISPGGGTEPACGHLWLLVAMNGSVRNGTSVEFLRHLASKEGLDWNAHWVARAALRERRKNDRLPDPDPPEWQRKGGYDRSFSENPQVFERYHNRGGYNYSLRHHRTLIRKSLDSLRRVGNAAQG